ncbi:MAG: GAF domain-containing protein, partial [Bdellovibrionia bacterium]
KDTIPPIFANVLSTRETLWHIEAKSLFALNLRKGEFQDRKYEGNYFTVIPLLQAGTPVGAVAITNYPDQTALDEIYRLEFESVLSLAVPIVTRLVAEETQTQEDEWFSGCQETAKKIRALSNDSSIKLSDALQKAARLLSDSSNAGVFVAQLEPATRRLHVQATSGYPEEIARIYHEFKFYAVSHNEQGPMPLAINRGKIVTIPDSSWIEGVLHKQSLEIFRQFQTRSCAAIPIQPSENDVPWGVIWIESKSIGQFSAQAEPGLKLLAQAVEDLILKVSLQGLHERAKSALAGFVPERVLHALLSGQDVRENEQGYLLMADLRDSTKLARKYGADAWTQFVGKLCKPAEAIAQKYGYSLQVVVWDALYFTSGKPKSSQELQNAVRMASELAALFGMEAQREFNEVLLPFDTNRARFCVTYGDVTRDVKNNFTSSWTIVGTAMASISKMEQTCKGFDGVLFCSEFALTDAGDITWEALPVRAKGTDELIYRFIGFGQSAAIAA